MMNFYLLHSVDTVTCSNITSASLNQECPLKVGGTEFMPLVLRGPYLAKNPAPKVGQTFELCHYTISV